MIELLADMLMLSKQDKVAVIGCGGKTSIIEQIGSEVRDMSVLITPTTKIYYPNRPTATILTDEDQCVKHKPKVGIQYMGRYNKEFGKLHALDSRLLEKLIHNYDLALMEADGSKGMWLKAWAVNEPVIPDFTTHTIGVTTLKTLSKPANNERIHRFNLFKELTGIQENENITLEHIKSMITKPKGMFQKAKGRNILLINQVETIKQFKTAEQLWNMILEETSGLIQQCLAGSIFRKEWVIFKN